MNRYYDDRTYTPHDIVTIIRNSQYWLHKFWRVLVVLEDSDADRIHDLLEELDNFVQNDEQKSLFNRHEER